MRWLSRYLDGERVQVWTEITALGAVLRRDEESFAEAVAVGEETMRRARSNVERLVDVLPSIGYLFGSERATPVFEPPPPDVTDKLDDLERRVGTLPLALRLWFEHVGQVDLTGNHPDWECPYPDPLVVTAPPSYLLSEFEEWKVDRAWWRGDFTIDFAPDALHKANVSGGPPYSMTVPNPGADGIVLWEPHQTTFLNLIRITFEWGGFPGWGQAQFRAPLAKFPESLASLAATLEPI